MAWREPNELPPAGLFAGRFAAKELLGAAGRLLIPVEGEAGRDIGRFAAVLLWLGARLNAGEWLADGLGRVLATEWFAGAVWVAMLLRLGALVCVPGVFRVCERPVEL